MSQRSAVASDILNPEGFRIDGRRSNEMRRIHCEMGVQPDADGSASIRIGNTHLIVSVFGPHDSRKRSHDGEHAVVNAEINWAPYASAAERKMRGRGDKRLLEMALVIKQTFQQVIQTELYPRSEIDLNIQVVQAEGGVLHAALNCSILAIIDAGIAVYDYVCACSAGCVEDTAILDLNTFEEQPHFDLPKFTVAVLPRSGQVVALHLEARMHQSRFELVRELAVCGARQIYAVLDGVVRNNCEKLLADIR